MNQPVVLVVDDDALIGKAITAYIDSLGLVAVYMANGYAAQQWLTKHAIALLLTDLEMPIVDGWQLCQMMASQAMVSRHPLPPIVVMTALLNLNAPPPASQAVLYKPFELSELETTLRRFLTLPVDATPTSRQHRRIDAADTIVRETSL